MGTWEFLRSSSFFEVVLIFEVIFISEVILIFEAVFCFEVIFIFQVVFLFEVVFIFKAVYILEVVFIFGQFQNDLQNSPTMVDVSIVTKISQEAHWNKQTDRQVDGQDNILSQDDDLIKGQEQKQFWCCFSLIPNYMPNNVLECTRMN